MGPMGVGVSCDFGSSVPKKKCPRGGRGGIPCIFGPFKANPHPGWGLQFQLKSALQQNKGCSRNHSSFHAEFGQFSLA